jgi:hypothetical protein
MGIQHFRAESKKEWHVNQEGALTETQIQLGAILRIADAVELMAKSYAGLISERDRYQRWYQERTAKLDRAERRIRGLQGYIKSLKKRNKK